MPARDIAPNHSYNQDTRGLLIPPGKLPTAIETINNAHNLVVKSGTINLYPVQGTKPPFRRLKIKENHNMKVSWVRSYII